MSTMLYVLFILTCASLVSPAEKKFGYFTMEYRSIGNPLDKNEYESSPVEYHFRLSRKTRHEKIISATFQVSRKVVDLKIQTLLYKYDRTSGYILEVQRPPISFCDEEVFPVLKRCLAWPANKNNNCSLNEGNLRLSGYSLEEETRGFIGNKTFYGDFRSRILFLEGDENHKIAGIDIDYIIKEAKQKSVDSNETR